jgi:trehalose 6-phosphate synthase
MPSERGARAGGLAVAIADCLQPGTLWFGWNGKTTGDTESVPTIETDDGIDYATISLGEADYRNFYVGFANGALWPLWHLQLGLIGFKREEYEGWRIVNRAFANALIPLLRPDDLIWVHDYHLIAVGAELRARGIGNRVGFFLHTPFVPVEVMRMMPRAETLLRELCAYDVVGFHTQEYRTEFLESAAAMLDIEPSGTGWFNFEGRSVHAIVTPIGINADGFAEMSSRAVRGAESKRLRDSLAGRALAVGVDRLDYSKGLLNRFEAFGRLLAQHPDHRRKVSFLQVAARSREDVADYRQLRQELDRIVGETNGQYSDSDWVPIRYITRPIKRDTIAGYFRVARIAVVTPLRDGMNLVAKEFIAAQTVTDPGVLILSRFAGAAEELTEALIVNPYDPDEIADAIHQALTMTLEERRARYQALRQKVWTTTARRYYSEFLRYLVNGEASTLGEHYDHALAAPASVGSSVSASGVRFLS